MIYTDSTKKAMKLAFEAHKEQTGHCHPDRGKRITEVVAAFI